MHFKFTASFAALCLTLALPGTSPSHTQAPPAGHARTLHVFAASSLSDAFTEIGHRFERERPGLTVRFNFAGSQQLATQLEQGASADVFASADERWMSHVRENGLLAGETIVFARNRLVVIVPAANPARVQRIQDLARGGIKLVLGAAAVPVGGYSRTVLRNLSHDPAFGGDFAARVLRNVVSEEEDVKSVVGKVQLGEADAGLVYRSDVTPGAARSLRVIAIPEGANVLAAYPISLLKNTKPSEAALAFVALVLSPAGQRALQRSGLIPVNLARP